MKACRWSKGVDGTKSRLGSGQAILGAEVHEVWVGLVSFREIVFFFFFFEKVEISGHMVGFLGILDSGISCNCRWVGSSICWWYAVVVFPWQGKV